MTTPTVETKTQTQDGQALIAAIPGVTIIGPADDAVDEHTPWGGDAQ